MDIVLLKDTNIFKSNWNISEIVSVDESRNELVRTVNIKYKICRPGVVYKSLKDKIMVRPVYRLVI